MNTSPVKPIRYWDVRHEAPREVPGHIVAETILCVHVNGQEWVTLVCSPHAVEDLIVGFLFLEGVIHTFEDLLGVVPTHNEHCVDVWLRKSAQPLPRKAVITSGCGGGITFEEATGTIPPVTREIRLPPTTIYELMRQLHQAAHAYRQARGIHAAGLSDGRQLLFSAEDVGRHNTIDRVCGQAFRAGMLPASRVLLTTGRISFEMVRKAAKMNIPIVVSRTSPTELAVRLAQVWKITIVGYARGHRLRIYTHPERIIQED